jgi:mono/diheme cytochrome c family protein
MTMSRVHVSLCLGIAAVVAIAAWAWGQGPAPGKAPSAPLPIRITMDELHKQGGVPKRWKFLVPPGDAARGREVFVALECFACHEVKGEQFPQASKTPPGSGPALTGMGSHHPAEYLAESIINPNRVIVLGPGFTGADSFSKMPDYSDSLSIRQLVDLVAYLKSLKGSGDGHAGMGKSKM